NASSLSSEERNEIDDHLSARHVDHDRSVDVAAPVPRRKHDELALDGDWQRFHSLFPARRQVSCSGEFLSEARWEIPRARLVVLADDPDVMRREIAGRRVVVASAVIVVVASVPMLIPVLVVLMPMLRRSRRRRQHTEEQDAECQFHRGLPMGRVNRKRCTRTLALATSTKRLSNLIPVAARMHFEGRAGTGKRTRV